MSEPAMPTIVLVHGAWHGSWCWSENVIPRFEENGYRCVAVELPGHDRVGTSSRLWHTVGAYVSHVEKEIAKIDGPIVLIGHSMGGLVIQRVVEQVNVAGVVLVASVPLKGAWGIFGRLLRNHPLTVLGSSAQLTMYPFVQGVERTRNLFFSPTTDETIVEKTSERLQNESYIAFLSMLLRLPKPAKNQSRTLVVSAELDGVFTLQEQAALAAAHSADQVIVKGAGHDLMLDTQWPEFADVCLDWIKDSTAS